MENYEQIGCLGRGSNGSKVYKVRSKITGELLAMKSIRISGDHSKIDNEVKILKSLRHPNIVSYVDSFIAEDSMLIFMEYAEKGDLNNYVKQCKSEGSSIPEEQIWKWLLQLGCALQYLESLKIIHRDIKVHNTFLDASNNIKLGDFGISKLLQYTLDQAHSTIGTPFYLSPEICLGVSYNFKSDIWMLGCLFYELCCLNRPFQGDSIPAIIHNIKLNEPPPINNKIYSQELINTIMKLLRKSPEDRPYIKDLLNSDEVKYKELVYFQSKSYQPHSSNGFLSRSFGERKYLKIDIKNSNLDNDQDTGKSAVNSNISYKSAKKMIRQSSLVRFI